MLRTTLFVVTLACAPLLVLSNRSEALAVAPPGAWSIDTVHSTVLFKIKHLNTSWTYGRFNSFRGEVVHDAAEPAKSTVRCEIDVASIDTANKDRDGHLTSPDFFSAREFQKLTFTSTKVEARGERLAVTGEIEMHGVKKPITMLVEPTGSSKSERMGERAGFHATTTLKRSDFGMKTMLEGIGDEVEIILSMELTR
jgi:polyisoprenoid-binding protein YceI